jgi:BON domain
MTPREPAYRMPTEIRTQIVLVPHSTEVTMHSLESIASSTQPKRSKPLYPLMNALFFAGALSGCATYSKCGFSGCPDDAKITANVKAEFGKHSELEAPDRVHVQTLNHVVYLTGDVSSGLQSRIAASVATQVKGVSGVENSISVDK